MKKMNNRYNRYQQKEQYNKNDSFDKKNRLISVLVLLAITLLFILNHLHDENKSLRDEMNMLNSEISEGDYKISSMRKEIDSLKTKPIQVIEKEKPKFLSTRTKKDTTKTPVKPIVKQPVVLMDTTKSTSY